MLIIKPLDKEIVEKLSVGLPPEIIKTRPGGRGKDLDYVSGSTVIDILNNAFGHNWSWTVKKFWREDSVPFYGKNDNLRENGIPQGPIIHCLGTLSVRFSDDENEFVICKDGFGAKAIVGGQSDQKDNYKSAATDALKKAASLFGIAAQLYRDENEQFFYESINYVDPWADEEVYQAHAAEREYLRNFVEKCGNHTELEQAVYKWSNGSTNEINDLLPQELTDFVNFLKKREAQNDSAQ